MQVSDLPYTWIPLFCKVPKYAILHISCGEKFASLKLLEFNVFFKMHLPFKSISLDLNFHENSDYFHLTEKHKNKIK